MSDDARTDDNESGADALTRRRFVQGSILAGAAILVPSAHAGENAISKLASALDPGQVRPKRGGTLRIASYQSGLDAIDPHLAADGNAQIRARQWAEPLLDRKQVRGLISGQPAPRIASVEPNNNWTQFKVVLRRGIRFHDGTPLTADDVIWSFKRLYDPARGNPKAAALVGFDPTRITRVDQRTVILRFLQPNTSALDELTLNPLIIKNGQDSFTGDTLIGTGPFKVTAYVPGGATSLVRNENYWLSGTPYVNRLEIIQFADDTARLNALLGGQVDAIQQLDTPLIRRYAKNKQFTILRSPGSLAWSFYMRLRTKPFNDARVREAFRLSVNRQQLVDSVLFGFGSVGNDLPGKGYPDYNAELSQRRYDPDRARFLLRRAGYPDGVKVTGLTYPDRAAEFAAYAQQAKKAGIKINLQTVPTAQYYAANNWPHPPTGFAQTRWSGAFGRNAVQQYLRAAPYNETDWRRPGWDRQFSKASSMLNASRRNEALKELQIPLWEQGGQIIWGFQDWLTLMSSRVQGMGRWIDEDIGGKDFRKVWLR
jgi:peptide/nickel transport system substrate-binding protein